MISLEELLSTTVGDLAKKQEQALVDNTVERLREIAEYLKKGEYENVLKLTEYSPSGDCMGCDNTYIDFHCGDIGETIEKLIELREVNKVKGEKQ